MLYTGFCFFFKINSMVYLVFIFFVVFFFCVLPRWTHSDPNVILTKRGIPIPHTAEHHPVLITVHIPSTNDEPFSKFFEKRSTSTSFLNFQTELEYERLHIDLLSASLGSMQLDLERNRDWLSPSFQSIRGGANSSSFHLHSLPLHCYYKGTVVGHPSSRVALSTCDGFSGVIHANETWVLHPLPNHGTSHLSRRNVEDHVLVKDVPRQSTCISTDTWPSSLNLSDIASIATSSSSKTVDLMLVSDYSRYQLLGTWTEPSLLEMMNYFTVLYQNAGQLLASVPLTIRLVGLFTATTPLFATATPTTTAVDADTLLLSFCAWKTQQQQLEQQRSPTTPSFLATNDIAHVFTARSVVSAKTTGTIQGYSVVGSVCTPSTSCGFVVSGLTPMLATQAHTMLHELGHQLGSTHDGNTNTCPASGFLMEASICEACGALSSTWSQCTVASVRSLFNTRSTSCLDSAPSLCGNGLLDPGEECDSGNPSGSSCCFSNCTLKATAQCDDRNGVCCQQCQFVAKNTPCRGIVTGDAREACDVEDVCSGTSVACENQVKPNGTVCFTDPTRPQVLDGACNRGVCGSRRQACAKMGYSYDTHCDESLENPCVLMCLNNATACVKFTYPSSPSTLLFAPEFSNCTVNNRNGKCVLGQCVPNTAGMAKLSSWMVPFVVFISTVLFL